MTNLRKLLLPISVELNIEKNDGDVTSTGNLKVSIGKVGSCTITSLPMWKS